MRGHLTRWALGTLLGVWQAASVAGTIEEFESKCRGLLESVVLSSVLPELRDASALYLRVAGLYVPEWVSPRPKQLAELKGEFVVVRRDGKREALSTFYPLRLEGHDLMVGTIDSGHSFRWALTNDLLVLEDRESRHPTTIKLRRTSPDPGRPELAQEPAWIDSWRRLYWSLVGEWRSVSMTASNFDEFAGATGIRLVMVDFGSQSLLVGANRYAQASGYLYAVEADGGEVLIQRPTLINPSSATIVFGIASDGFSVQYSFEDGLLVLRRKSGAEYLEAKLKRVRTDPAPATPGDKK